ncbi:hypothetical protein P8452_73945 [Trifolium repens]|nr:embryo-specific protein ATS3B [Trifolium repens]WJX92284.1 hypothetical protein P8452_73945 [Trifolium repens]
MKALTLILLTFSITVTVSHGTPTLITHPQPQMNLSSILNHIQQIDETRLVGGACNYLVTIKTSCSSPPHTTDEISLLFGDANGSELYVERLNDPDPETFEQCSTISFEILGPCVGKICQLYLFRNGTDGWMPETVTAYYNDYPPITFTYNIFIPQGVSSGFNYCDNKN